MQYENSLTQRLLALVLMAVIIMTSISIDSFAGDQIRQEDAITKAVDWLKENQNSDGSWGTGETAFLDTSEVLTFFAQYNVAVDNLMKAVSWVETLEPINYDMAARILPFVKNEDKHEQITNSLLSSQNADGGWGIVEGYESDILDTILVFNALVADENSDLTVLQKAISFIINCQHSNGSWSFRGDDESVISLTAKTAIALVFFQTKTNLTSSELQTSVRKAGEYLLSVQQEDKTWGTTEDSIVDTLISYRAVMNTIGLDAADTIDNEIINAQRADGSWFGSPYITALAIQAIKDRMDMPYAKINSIQLFKNDNGTKTECYSFNAFETLEAKVDCTYSNADVKLLYFIKQTDGNVVEVGSKGLVCWNTSNSLPGTYSLIVVVQDNGTGGVLTTSEKSFEILPTSRILEFGINLDVDATEVGRSVDINAKATIVNASNFDKQYKVKTVVLDGSQEVSYSERMVEIKASEQTQIFNIIAFSPDVETVKDYIVKAEVLDGETSLADGQSTFRVLPLPPETRIDITQSLNKDIIYPGNDTVEVTYSLKGQGVLPLQDNNNMQAMFFAPQDVTYQQTTSQQNSGYANGKMYNEFIEYAVNTAGERSGRFTIGTTGGNPDITSDDYKIMLYGHPTPWSSLTTVKVDGRNYIYNPNTQSPVPNVDDLSITSEQIINNVSIKQIISIVPNASTQRSDIVEIRYLVKNNDTSDHELGLRIMMDTMLGDNDHAPFRIPGIGAVTTELELTGNNIPQYWQAFDNLINPTVISQGTLLYSGDKKPDKVQFTNWLRAYENYWLDSVKSGTPNGDSAVSVYWNPTIITPGETREYVTYYGLSEFQQDLTGILTVSLTGANNVVVENNRYSPNPFTVTTYISNIGFSTANNVKASIILPDGLKLVEGENSEKNIGSLGSRQEEQVSWDIEIEPSAVERNLIYSVSVSADGIAPKSLSRSLHIPALYDDTSGKNVVLETCIPDGNMKIDINGFAPAPTESIDNSDRSITLRWNFERIAIGEEKIIRIKYIGKDLESDTIVPLTKRSKLSYQDRNNSVINLELPDLKIAVSKYILDSQVNTDKLSYAVNENVNINNIIKNLTNHECILSGKVEITDINGNVVKVLTDTVTNTWNAGETKSMDFIWNTGKTLTGTYKVRVTWSEGEKVISIAESSFDIMADRSLSSSVTVDKQKYSADEEVNIIGKVKNDSINNIENGLKAIINIRNPEGTVVWTADNMLLELLPNVQTSLKNAWNTSKNAPGQYTVNMEVYKGTEKLTESSASFEIAAEAEGIMEVSGSLQILQNYILPTDAVGFMYTINNTGNVKLEDITARIRIVDVNNESVIGMITDTLSIDVDESYTSEKTWNHDTLEMGTYMVVFDAILSNGKEVPLTSGHIKVEKPYETVVNQVVSPRVLVWAESQDNINLAENALGDMQAYYKVVNTREAFMAELRTGKYNLYMLLDSKKPLTGHDDQELAKEVAKGKGIIASRDANGDNLKNLGLFGVKFKGSTTPHDFTVEFSAGTEFGNLTLSGTGKAQDLTLNGGQELAVLKSKKGTSPGVVISQYQNGKSLLFAFDIGSCTGDIERVLKKAVELTVPASEADSGLVELEINIEVYKAVAAEIKLDIPQGAEIIWISPDESKWAFDAEIGQDYTFYVVLKLPQETGQYPVSVDSYYLTPDGIVKCDSEQIIITGF